METKVINLLGGPGCGKTAVAHGIMADFKRDGESVEYVNELAKDLTWEGRSLALDDQLYVLAKQHRNMYRLLGKVKWIVTDTSLLLGAYYVHDSYHKFDIYRRQRIIPLVAELAKEYFDCYDNHNFVVDRGVKPYETAGRRQSEEEARQIDDDIKKMLDQLGVPWKLLKRAKDVDFVWNIRGRNAAQ